MFIDALSEYRADWLLAGKARSTVDCHQSLLRLLGSLNVDPDLPTVRSWISSAPTASMRRKRAQAVRAFGKWSETVGDNDLPWWRNVRVPTETENPQITATEADFQAALDAMTSVRDKAILSVLWGCGLRRSELARLAVSDVLLSESALVVRTSKSGRPRVVPMPPIARRLVRRHLRNWAETNLFGLSANGVHQMLRRQAIFPAHAWRRGWAVQTLKSGVSEASLRAAAGWTSGAMVSRYTRAMATELALEEFQRAWGAD